MPLNARLRLVEGGALEARAVRVARRRRIAASRRRRRPRRSPPERDVALRAVPGAGLLAARTVSGETRSLAALRGRPAVLLFWSTERQRIARGARRARARERRAGAGRRRRARHRARSRPRTCRRSARRLRPALPVVAASPELGLSYAILNRHLFMNRQDLRLPTALLLDAAGRVVKAYRDRVDVARIVRDAAAIDAPAGRAPRARRAVPGHVLLAAAGSATTCPTGASCWIRGWRRPRVVAFERAAQANPSASTLYRLGHAAGEERRAGARAGRVRARARAAARPRRGEQRPRRAARAGRRPRGGHRPLPRGARRDARLSGCAQQPRLRAAADRTRRGSARALREGAGAAARLSRSAQQPGPALRPRRRAGRARSATSATRWRGAPTTARRRTTWRSSSSRAARPTAAVRLLERFLEKTPAVRGHLRDARQDPLQRRPRRARASACSSGCCSATRRIPSRSSCSASGRSDADPSSDDRPRDRHSLSLAA